MKNVLAACAIMVVGAVPAMAQDLIPYGEAAGWDISVDPTVGNGCVMHSEFDDGSAVRIGFDMTQDQGYITSMNAAWGDIVEGQAYPISIALDGNSFEGEATGIVIDDLPGADVLFVNPDFFTGLIEAKSLVLSHDGTEVMSLDISGSGEAIGALITCQDEQIAKAGG
jgi:hypothetical protein